MESDNKTTVIFLTGSLNSSSGGRAQSIFSRAKLLSKSFDKIFILTLNHNSVYPESVRDIRARYSLSEKIVFSNFFFSLANEFKSDVFAIGSKPMHVELKNSEDGKIVVQERYFDSNNQLYFILNNFRERNDYSCIWVNKNKSRKFPTLRSARQYWIADFAKSSNKVIFLLEDRHYDSLVLDNQYNDGLISIATVHGNHLKQPYRFDSEITDYLKPMIAHLNMYDAVVFLTDKQKEYVSNRFGERDSYCVIRHPIPTNIDKVKQKSTNSKTISMLARLVSIKQIDHAIKAMKYVVEHDRDVCLNIYGKGEEAKNLEELIRSLKLQNNIKLMGYTDNPKKVLLESSISLITSQTEAFCLSIQESLALGTPVVSYNCNFGPSEMIIDGKNGRLVEQGNIEGLAKAILDILENDQVLFSMSRQAIEESYRFSDANILKKWEALIDEKLHLDINTRNIDRNISIDSARVIDSELEQINGRIKLNISIAAKGFLLDGENADYYLYNNNIEAFETEKRTHYRAIDKEKVGEEIVSEFSLNFDETRIEQLFLNGDFAIAVQNGSYVSFFKLKTFARDVFILLLSSSFELKSFVNKLCVTSKSSILDNIDFNFFSSTNSKNGNQLKRYLDAERDSFKIEISNIDLSVGNGGELNICGTIKSSLEFERLNNRLYAFREDDKELGPLVVECGEERESYYFSIKLTHRQLTNKNQMFQGKTSSRIYFKYVAEGGIFPISKSIKLATARFGLLFAVSYKGKRIITLA